MNDRLKCLLADVFGMREDDVHMHLANEDVGSWDSLKQMDLVTSLEREYSILLEITDIVQMISVSSIVKVLHEKGVELGD